MDVVDVEKLVDNIAIVIGALVTFTSCLVGHGIDLRKNVFLSKYILFVAIRKGLENSKTVSTCL